MGELQSVDLGQPTRIIVSVFRHTAKLLSGPDLKLQIPYTLTLTTDPGYVVRDAMLNMPLAPLGTYSQPLHTHSSSAPTLAFISECVRSAVAGRGSELLRVASILSTFRSIQHFACPVQKEETETKHSQKWEANTQTGTKPKCGSI